MPSNLFSTKQFYFEHFKCLIPLPANSIFMSTFGYYYLKIFLYSQGSFFVDISPGNPYHFFCTPSCQTQSVENSFACLSSDEATSYTCVQYLLIHTSIKQKYLHVCVRLQGKSSSQNPLMCKIDLHSLVLIPTALRKIWRLSKKENSLFFLYQIQK